MKITRPNVVHLTFCKAFLLFWRSGNEALPCLCLCSSITRQAGSRGIDPFPRTGFQATQADHLRSSKMATMITNLINFSPFKIKLVKLQTTILACYDLNINFNFVRSVKKFTSFSVFPQMAHKLDNEVALTTMLESRPQLLVRAFPCKQLQGRLMTRPVTILLLYSGA